LVRHPAADVAAGICYGRLDVPVTDAAAVASLVARLVGLGGTIWTSPAQRCRMVAEALGAARIDPRLQELDFGAWEGLAWDEVPRAALDAWAADVSGFAPPGGERGSALIARVTAFASGLSGGDHVVVTHGGPLKVLTALFRGLPVDLLAPSPALGSVTLIG
jgi:alpha-ribazole phosphatase